MVLPASGAISLSNIQTEFGGTTPISISEYYGVASGIPVSGTISLSNFYGTSSIPGRGVFGAGAATYAPSTLAHYNTLDYITISTTGNATDFGDLAIAVRFRGSCSSTTRGVFAGGGTQLPTPVNYYARMDYITLATTGNSTLFGNLTVNSQENAGCSSPTRGIFAGGFDYPSVPGVQMYNIISYVTIATAANATDFGDLTLAREFADGACSSPTRGIFVGGEDFSLVPRVRYNNIDYITIATIGNATDFGDLSGNAKAEITTCSSPTRGVFAGGTYFNPVPSGFITAEISYVTIATTGNSTSFGSLISYWRSSAGGTSNSNRGVFGGGWNVNFSTPGTTFDDNSIQYITIGTLGNSIDFGDLTVARGGVTACSDSDGGLT